MGHVSRFGNVWGGERQRTWRATESSAVKRIMTHKDKPSRSGRQSTTPATRAPRSVNYSPRGRVKKHLENRVPRLEVEQIAEGTSLGIVGEVADSSQPPVVFDEAQNRSLVGHRMIDEILLGEGRYDQQR